jgi:hypothetical protein
MVRAAITSALGLSSLLIRHQDFSCPPRLSRLKRSELNRIMNTQRLLPVTLAISFLAIGATFSQDDKANNAPANEAVKDSKPGTNTEESAGATKKAPSSQSELASKTVTFEKIDKDSEIYTNAVEAHDFTKAKEQLDKKGAMRGTVAKIFEPRGNSMAIVNFDAKYQSALTAVVRKSDFSKFPDLKKLVGKPVVISGKFIDYQGRPEFVLTSPDQIKLVE